MTLYQLITFIVISLTVAVLLIQFAEWCIVAYYERNSNATSCRPKVTLPEGEQ